MDFQLSDAQRAIADIAGSLFGDLCNDDRLRASTNSGETWMADHGILVMAPSSQPMEHLFIPITPPAPTTYV